MHSISRRSAHRVRLAVLLAGVTLLAAAPFALAQPSPTWFCDVDFLDANWTSTKILDTTGGSSATFVAGQVTTGGNPGAFRHVEHTFGAGAIRVAHVRAGAIYDPSVSGPIQRVDYSYDLQHITALGAVRYTLVLVQGGAYYANVATFDDVFGATWLSFARQGLVAGDFSLVAGVGPANPDFSATGGPIQFGYASSNSAGGGMTTKDSGIDNWCIAIHNAPCLDVQVEASGSPCRCGIVGLPIVHTCRPNPGAAVTDDCVTLTISVDNNSGAALARNLRICTDLSVINPKKGFTEHTRFFRACVGNNPVRNPLSFPPGRTVMQLAMSSSAIKSQLAALIATTGSINLPFKVLVDDPAVDSNLCALDGTSCVDEATAIAGLRRAPGQDDDGTAESLRGSVNATSLMNDSLEVYIAPEQLPHVPFTVTDLEVHGGDVGGGMGGLDALELRRARLVGGRPHCPDMGPFGLVLKVGNVDGVLSVPMTATADYRMPPDPGMPTLLDPAQFPAGLFVRGVFMPGETASAFTGIGADETAVTLLGHSAATSGANPTVCAFDASANYMLRLIMRCP